MPNLRTQALHVPAIHRTNISTILTNAGLETEEVYRFGETEIWTNPSQTVSVQIGYGADYYVRVSFNILMANANTVTNARSIIDAAELVQAELDVFAATEIEEPPV